MEDEQVEKNHGVWELIIESGKTTKIVSTCDYDSDKVITASIGIWSQIFLGYSTIVELAKYGEVCGNKKIIAQLNKSIPAKHVRLFDFF